MTAIPQSAFAGDVSEQLTAPLREVARRRWVVDAAVAVIKTLIAGLMSLLAATLVLGYFQNLWMPARVVFAVVTWAVVIASVVRFLRPTFRRWTLSHAAMQVEQDRPDLHERLSSAIELAGKNDQAFQGSPALLNHLFRQAEVDAGAVQPSQVVPTDRVLRWAILLTPMLIAWMTLVFMPATTHTTLAGLYRVLMPWKSSLPAMLTEVLVKPGDVTLAQGDPVDISAHLSFGSHDSRAILVRKFASGETLSNAMENTDPSDYTLHLENLQQTFSYRVSTGEGDSDWFTATIHPRPKITSLDVRCDYPGYTGLAATVTSDRDGAIQALAGTRITLTVHTVTPIAVEKSHVVLNGGTDSQTTLPLKQLETGGTDYQAQFVVSQNGDYRINLTNEFDLTNKDEQPRGIIVVPDEVPTIVITSPPQQVTVGAEDTVPVKFIAKDDFGITRIEAIVQVDDRPARTVQVPFATTDKKRVTGPPFMISVADVLKSERISKAAAISYQLKVTDNRDPDPQLGFSNRQTLRIDLNQYQNYQAREDQKTAQDLTQAIQRAINQLNQEERQIQPARDEDARRSLEDWRRKQLDEAAQELPRTSKQLDQAAEEAKDSVFQEIAKKVQDIADKPIQFAADDAAQADLNVERGQERKDAAARATAEIAQAQTELRKLLDSRAIEKQLQQAEAARDLADAAQKQQEAAEIMKSPEQLQQQPQNRQAQQEQRQAMRKQEQADQRLQQAMQQSEALRDPQAQETAHQLEDLIRKVEDAEKKQEATARQTDKLQAAEQVRQDANAIAQQQEALNKEIQKSAEKNKQALEKANANPPSADQQQNIVKALDQNQIQQAHQQMQQSANQLHQAAQQLQNQARSTELHPTQHQQEAVNEDQHAVEQAQKEHDAAEQAADEMKQPADAQTPNPDDQGVADAKNAAQAIQKQAGELHPQNEDAQNAADAAEKHAEAAEHAADQAANAPNPQEAQQHRNEAAAELKQAAHALADAAKKNADAHKGQMVAAQQKNAQAAADQTEQEAQKQEALAQALAGEEHALAKVQNPPQSDQTAQQQNEATEQTKDAKKHAEQLQQQAHDANNPNVEARAKQANRDLAAAQEHAHQAAQAQQQAAQHQQEAANANNAQEAAAAEKNENRDLQQAVDQQQQAEAALAKAEGELRNAPAEAQQANGQPTASQQAAQAAQEAAQAQQEASQQNPAAAHQAANALAHAAQQLAKATQGMEQGQPENGQPHQADVAMKASPNADRANESREGIMLAGLPVSLPASLLDMGITADQWAVLPPLVKKDLLNAAQQNGPPAYRQMMREYFAKVAKMQETSDGK